MKTKFIFFIFFSFNILSLSCQDTTSKILTFSIENDVLLSPLIYFGNYKKNSLAEHQSIYLSGSLNVEFKTTKHVKKSLFVGYLYNLNKTSYAIPNYLPFVGSAGIKITEEKEESLYFITGLNFKFTNKNKLNRFFNSIGFGGGKTILKGNNYLYNSKTAWCNSIDFGYIFVYKHIYFKPFIGLLSIFTYKELIDYNDGRTITDGNLNYYSQNNPEKSSLYKSSFSPAPSQIQIKYRYWGLTNTTFLPRGLLCIGITF